MTLIAKAIDVYLESEAARIDLNLRSPQVPNIPLLPGRAPLMYYKAETRSCKINQILIVYITHIAENL